jgi:hypothetical protein
MRYDGDRAGGVVQDGLADRAEQQTGEAAAAAGADHGELRPVGRVDQDLAGAAVAQFAVYDDVEACGTSARSTR